MSAARSGLPAGTIVRGQRDEPDPGATSSSGRPMRADAQRNFDAIVSAARTMFAREGGQVSLDAVAKEAGVGAGTLYRHFPQRIDLVEAVYQEDVDGLTEAADRVERELGPWPAMEEWLEAFVRYATTKRSLLNELHEAFEKNPALRSVCREKIETSVSRVLQRAQAAGVARNDLSGPDLMQLLSSMCMSATLTTDQCDRLMVMIKDGLRQPV
ncbi:MAG: TetR/AcrR family transcriptional regulator [Acidimicrobiales bacterium]